MKSYHLESNRRHYGFTLIELLAVILIIGIVVSAATLAFGDNQAERIQQKSLQLAALIELAKEQAIFNSQELGILFTEDSYEFYHLSSIEDKDKNESKSKDKKNTWAPINQNRLLNKRTLPDGLEYELFLEGVKVNFSAAKLDDITPHVFVLSDGTISPFKLNLTDQADHSLVMNFTENGEYELLDANQ